MRFFVLYMASHVVSMNQTRRISFGAFKGLATPLSPKFGQLSLSTTKHTVIAGQGLKKLVQTHDALVSLRTEKDAEGTFMVPLSSGGFAKTTLIAVPNEVGRFNCKSRPDALAKSLLAVTQSTKSNLSLNLSVADRSDVLASAMAVFRSCPFVTYKHDSNKPASAVEVTFQIESGESLTEAEIHEISTIGNAVRMAQALTDLPPNELNPDSFTEIVSSMCGGLDGVGVEVIENCEQRGLLGIHNVGKASRHKPRMIVLTHSVSGESPSSSVTAIVGKGITYDTGGLSVKPSNSMKGMKRDMGGAAAALGAFVALAQLPRTEPKTLHCILCIAENSLGSASFRNDDIFNLYSGKSVEINNTDAEGRLLLADGVAFASKDLKAGTIFDIATLTGAASIASGKLHASFVSTDADLARAVVDAGMATGDLVHELPFCPELLKPNLKSTLADMKNSTVTPGDAPSAVAAYFVYENLKGSGFKGTRWAHIDMASVVDYLGERSTGYGVALLAKLIRK